MIPNKSENPNGLHRHYEVRKANGDLVDENAEYFVLRLDFGGDDQAHIEACRKAITTYADEIAAHIPQLASDLKTRYAPPPESIMTDQWQSIETAPKDGRQLLLGWWAWWPERQWCYEVAPAGNIDVARPGCGSLHGYATHWMPLPAPPP